MLPLNIAFRNIGHINLGFALILSPKISSKQLEKNKNLLAQAIRVF